MKKNCLVTGASGEIGGAIALGLLHQGHRVAFGCFSRADETRALCDAQRAKGLDALCLPFDARKKDECFGAVRELQSAFGGGVDILIHAAGQGSRALIQDMDERQWQDLFALHVDAAFFLTQAVLPHMLEKKSGCILNIGSIWGQVGASMEVAYSAAKAALMGYSKALAKELGPSNIRVNVLSPGFIHTAMNSDLPPGAAESFIDETPLMRAGTPKDVMEAALFLCSEAASFITGQVIGVNGGCVI